MYKHLLVVSNGRPFTRKVPEGADETNIVLLRVANTAASRR